MAGLMVRRSTRGLGDRGRFGLVRQSMSMRLGGGDEAVKERVGVIRFRKEFGMSLGRDEVRVVADLDELNQAIVRAGPGHAQTCLLERVAVSVVHFPAVPMPFIHNFLAVELSGERAFRELRRVQTESHGSTLVGHVLLGLHQVDHGIGRHRIELARMRSSDAEDVS